jgi:hypothetical protein
MHYLIQPNVVVLEKAAVMQMAWRLSALESTQLSHVPCRIDPINIITSHFTKIHFAIIIPNTPTLLHFELLLAFKG